MSAAYLIIGTRTVHTVIVDEVTMLKCIVVRKTLILVLIISAAPLTSGYFLLLLIDALMLAFWQVFYFFLVG